jgi:hypothetical protein
MVSTFIILQFVPRYHHMIVPVNIHRFPEYHQGSLAAAQYQILNPTDLSNQK